MSDDKGKLKVLFLCTGNSCRSQIAEGWARELKSEVMEVCSAGVSPVGVNQMAVEVMAEAGVDISKQYSKHVDQFKDIDFDYVVTVCDYAKQKCPVFPRRAKRIHKLFIGPFFMESSQEEIVKAFRQLRDDIKAFVETMPQSLETLSA